MKAMPALSGMLITTGLGMLNPAEFKHCYAVQKMDTVPFLTTVAGMIAFGLAEGIGLGCASAVALNYHQASSAVGEEPTQLQVEEVPQFIDVGTRVTHSTTNQGMCPCETNRVFYSTIHG